MKKQSKATTVKKSSNGRKRIYWVVGTLVVLVIVFFLSSWIIRSFTQFSYKGLTFTKETKYGVPFYHYYYYFTDSLGRLTKYNLYLRTDPRVNEVPISGRVLFNMNRNVYLGINISDLSQCSNSSLAIAELSSFLTDNEFKVKAGVPTKSQAQELNQTYISCTEYLGSTVLMLQAAGNNSIVGRNGCYTMNIANCNILPVVEKFKIQAILDSRTNSTSS
ncbi:hypothetical protein KW787_02610 [Candidatus Pacearchaeota archaeon]|nr:hypothetical protein [Candidatus Pacearchaeota archaeon]